MLPYLLLCREDSPQRKHDLRTVFNAVRSLLWVGRTQGAAHGGLHRQPHASVLARKRRQGSKVHIAVDMFGHLLALTVTLADLGARRASPGGHRRDRGDGLCRSGIHRTECRRRRATARPALGGGQTPHGEERHRLVAKTMGRRAQLRLGRSLPPPRQRLRTPGDNAQRTTPHRLRHPHAPESRAHPQSKSLTDSNCHDSSFVV